MSQNTNGNKFVREAREAGEQYAAQVMQGVKNLASLVAGSQEQAYLVA